MLQSLTDVLHLNEIVSFFSSVGPTSADQWISAIQDNLLRLYKRLEVLNPFTWIEGPLLQGPDAESGLWDEALDLNEVYVPLYLQETKKQERLAVISVY